jgi:3-phosphoshikimate 1-carboxyvinyltransferase
VNGIRVRPGVVSGACAAPASKSYTHRALVAAASLGIGLRIRNPLDSEDTRATRKALVQLGYPVSGSPDEWTVRARDPADARGRALRIQCGESGTTLRFVTALAARDPRSVRLTGAARLGIRPMDGLLNALSTLGATARRDGTSAWSVRVEGPIHGGSVRVPAYETSQFVSALLISLGGLGTPSDILPEGPIVSRPYLTATLRLLDQLGGRIQARQRGWAVGGSHRRGSRVWTVPGDISSAAYLWTAAAVTGGDVRTDALNMDWPQADQAMLAVLRDSGATVEARRTWVRVRGRSVRPFSVNLDDSPDLLPLAGVLAATIPGRSRILGARHAADKESDRRRGTADLVRGLGASESLSSTRLDISGTSQPRGVRAYGSSDHRLVASAAVAALASSSPSHLLHPEAVRKSYPGLWRDLRALGADLQEDG